MTRYEDHLPPGIQSLTSTKTAVYCGGKAKHRWGKTIPSRWEAFRREGETFRRRGKAKPRLPMLSDDEGKPSDDERKLDGTGGKLENAKVTVLSCS